jgi:hypothetical protein
MRRFHHHARQENGIAMITVMLTSMVVVGLSLSAVQLSQHGLSSTATDRKRIQAADAAEAGLDVTLAALQANPYPTLPCTVSGTLSDTPTTASYSVAITYYATFPPTGAPLTCSSGLSSQPAAAEIVSTGNTQAVVAGKRQMDSLVKLSPVVGSSSGFNRAIFSEQGPLLNNSLTINGHSGQDGDIYSNGNIICNNSATVHGSIFTQGTLLLNNSCHVTVDAYAKGNLTTNNASNIGHDAISSQGNISLGNTSTVAHDATAKGTNTGGTVTGQRRSNQTGIPDPPTATMPTLNWNAAAWTSAGYTVVDEGTNCTQAHNDIATMSTATVNKVYRITGSCKMTWGNNETITLARDLAVVADGGFLWNNSFKVKSSVAGVPHKVSWIVPSDAVTVASPCGTADNGLHNMQATNANSSTSDITVFFYTPCNISMNNAVAGGGQIYAGRVKINNAFTLNYIPAEVPGAASASTTLYTVAISYKRETPAS